MAIGRAPAGRARVARWGRSALVLLLLLLAPVAGHALAADGAAGGVRLTVTPLIEGMARPGDWVSIRVHAENDGPAVTGELRVSSTEEGAPWFSLPVELATGARQDHELYAQTSWFGGRWSVDLVQDGASVVSVPLAVRSIDSDVAVVALVAEHPERIAADLRTALAARTSRDGSTPPRVVTVEPGDLPRRAEGWGTIDAIVWQDAPTAALEPDQLEALHTWLTLGGTLAVFGGSAGPSALDGLPDDLLPFRPDGTVDIPPAELTGLIDTLPADLTTLPALAGTAARGTILARHGDRVVAARQPIGRGSVAIVGIDPAAPGLASTPAGAALWQATIPADLLRSQLRTADDTGFLGEALGFLPTLDPPRIDLLVALFVLYLLLLGPIGYLVLRRLDRREWAWILIPALAVGFTVVAYGVGVAANGTQVMVRELGVVQGAAGSDRGVADVAVGIVSPVRTTLDLHIPGGALISRNPSSATGLGRTDVVLGADAGIRGVDIGAGAVRDFHVQRVVPIPHLATDLTLTGERLQGTLTNASDLPLDDVHLAWGAGLQALGDLPPGASVSVDLPVADPQTRGSFAERLFATPPGPTQAERRTALARLAILRSLSGGWNWDPTSIRDPLGVDGPVVLGWTSGGVLGADVGRDATAIGDTLYLLPVAFQATGPVSFGGGTLLPKDVRIVATDGWVAPDGTMALGRGTMTMSFQSTGLDGRLAVDELLLRLARSQGPVAEDAEDAVVLPADQQPTAADPVGTGPAMDLSSELVPRLQLFDRVAGTWVELAPFRTGRTYRVPDPERYVDGAGAFEVRAVNRDRSAVLDFSIDARLSGTATTAGDAS